MLFLWSLGGAFSFFNGYSAATATSRSSPKSLRWETGGENQDIFISHFALGPRDFSVSQLMCCTREIKVGVHQTCPVFCISTLLLKKTPFLALTTAECFCQFSIIKLSTHPVISPILENSSFHISFCLGDRAFVQLLLAWQVEIRKLATNYNIWNLHLIDSLSWSVVFNALPPYLAQPQSLFWTALISLFFLLIIFYLPFLTK